MLVTWKYRPRNTLMQRLDPRARLIFFLCYLLSVFMFWDVRVLSGFLVITLLTVLSAKLSWKDTRQTWLLMGSFTTFYALITFITGLVSYPTEPAQPAQPPASLSDTAR